MIKFISVAAVVFAFSAQAAEKPDFSKIKLGDAPVFVNGSEFTLSHDLSFETNSHTKDLELSIYQSGWWSSNTCKFSINKFDLAAAKLDDVESLRIRKGSRVVLHDFSSQYLMGDLFNQGAMMVGSIGEIIAPNGRRVDVTLSCLRNYHRGDDQFSVLSEAIHKLGLTGEFKAPRLVPNDLGGSTNVSATAPAEGTR